LQCEDEIARLRERVSELEHESARGSSADGAEGEMTGTKAHPLNEERLRELPTQNTKAWPT